MSFLFSVSLRDYINWQRRYRTHIQWNARNACTTLL